MLQSKYTPRFLADADGLMTELPTVSTFSGSLFKLEGEPIMRSTVLSSFSLSLLYVIHDLISDKQLFNFLEARFLSLGDFGSNEIYSCVSSA